MKLYVLLVVPCIFLLSFVTADETTITAENVEADTPTETKKAAIDAPENKPEPGVNSVADAKDEKSAAEAPVIEGTTRGDVSLPQDKTTAEEKIPEEEKTVEQIVVQTTPGKVDKPAPEVNGEDADKATGDKVSTPTPSDQTLLKTLSDLTDQNKVKESEAETDKKPDETKIAESKDGKVKSKKIKIAEFQEDQLAEDTKDQDQQEVSLVFPTDLAKKDDEFEAMAKNLSKPNKVLDNALADKLQPNYTDHLDHNKEDEHPNFVFESQENMDKKNPKELEEKIEPETKLTDDDKETPLKDKDVRMADLTAGGTTKTPDSAKIETIFLDESDENSDDTKTKKSPNKTKKNKKGNKGDKQDHGPHEEIKGVEKINHKEQVDELKHGHEGEGADDEKDEPNETQNHNAKRDHSEKQHNDEKQNHVETHDQDGKNKLDQDAGYNHDKMQDHDENQDHSSHKEIKGIEKINHKDYKEKEDELKHGHQGEKESDEKPDHSLKEIKGKHEINHKDHNEQEEEEGLKHGNAGEREGGKKPAHEKTNDHSSHEEVKGIEKINHKKDVDKLKHGHEEDKTDDNKDHDNSSMEKTKQDKGHKVGHKSKEQKDEGHESSHEREDNEDHSSKEKIEDVKHVDKSHKGESKDKSNKSNHEKVQTNNEKAAASLKSLTPPKDKKVNKNQSKEAPKIKKHDQLTEEELIKHASQFETLQSTTTELPAPKIPSLDTSTVTPENQTKAEDDGTNVNTTLVFAEIIFRHGDRYKGLDKDETFPKDPYAEEDPFWLPYGCDQLRNKGKMRSFWLGQYLRKRYNGFLGEEYYHNDIRITSADLNRCIDSAHVVGAGLYPPKGINIWNDSVGRFYQPLAVRTLDPTDDIYLNEELQCLPYENELAKVLTKKMKNFNKKYKYVYEYLEMYAGMPIKNLEDVAQVYTTLRIENENGRKLPDWVNLVFPTLLKTLNSYYNQIRFSSHFFKKIQAGPLLTILTDELKQKSINRLKPNYKMKFWSGFDTTILKLLYTMKETQPSLDKAEDLLETDYSGALMIELHLIKKKHYVKVFYINMDPMFFKSHSPRTVKICDGLSLCPLDDFLARMKKYRITQKEWYHACNRTYCKVDQMEKICFN